MFPKGKSIMTGFKNRKWFVLPDVQRQLIPQLRGSGWNCLMAEEDWEEVLAHPGWRDHTCSKLQDPGEVPVQKNKTENLPAPLCAFKQTTTSHLAQFCALSSTCHLFSKWHSFSLAEVFETQLLFHFVWGLLPWCFASKMNWRKMKCWIMNSFGFTNQNRTSEFWKSVCCITW